MFEALIGLAFLIFLLTWVIPFVGGLIVAVIGGICMAIDSIFGDGGK